MTPKGSMNSATFMTYLKHFSYYKPAGTCLLIVDGAKCHFDNEIAVADEKYDIKLFCLPSNTTHELQPLDKSIFKPLENTWDDEVSLFCDLQSERTLSKVDFCQIFTKAWIRSVIVKNMVNGFEACGIYPYDPSRICEDAYALSQITHQ